MSHLGVTFDPDNVKTVYASREPELYDIALSSIKDTDGIFSYRGQLWTVGETVEEEWLEIWPALK